MTKGGGINDASFPNVELTLPHHLARGIKYIDRTLFFLPGHDL
jgi:hypothetical protein